MQGDQRGLCRHGLGKSMDRLGLGSLLFETEEKERETEWMDGWTDERRKEGKTSRQHRSQKGSALTLRKFLVTCAQGALHFHFSLGSANYVTGPTLGKDLCKFHCMKWMESLFSVFLRVKQLSVNWQRRQWHPTPVLLPGKSHGRRSLVSYSPWGHKELDTTERLILSLFKAPAKRLLDFKKGINCSGITEAPSPPPQQQIPAVLIDFN